MMPATEAADELLKTPSREASGRYVQDLVVGDGLDPPTRG
jgi:hypothetical protein